MTTNLTAPQARVTDEELDHLIWGLQREGFHARTLAALVELRELKKAQEVVIPLIWKHYTGADVAGIYEQTMTEAGINWRSAGNAGTPDK